MILAKGDCYSDIKENNVYLATCNNVVKYNGELVMGKGNAKSLTLAFKEEPIALSLGSHITKANNPREYNLIILKCNKNSNIYYGAFQTKYDFKNPSDIDLIKRSVERLKNVAIKNPNITFNLPFPGIGLGGLKYEDVFKIIQDLPDNVKVWTL